MKKRDFYKRISMIIASVFMLCACTCTAIATSSDPVYESMTESSESQSDYMKKANRNKGQILGDPQATDLTRVVSIGAIYKTSGKTLPSNFSVYIGKMKLFAYSLSKARWIVLDDQPYPSGFYIYTLPWTSSKATKCDNVTYTDSYAKIDLRAKDLDNAVLHFWGKSADMDKSDYLFYACAYTFWTDSSVAGKLTATNGIDAKGSGSTETVQLYSSRGLSSSTSPKTHWGHTVPESEYKKYNTSTLNQLFLTGQVEPDLYHNTSSSTKKVVLVDPNQKKTAITSIKLQKDSVRVVWKKRTKDLDGYQLQYSTNKNFKKSVKSKVIKKATTNSKTFKQLKSGKRYYFRIRTYKKIGKLKIYSKWSKTKSIRLK